MRKPLNILFYENRDPIDHRCIGRFLLAFPKGYWKVVREAIKRTQSGLDEKTFRLNVAKLLPSFKMTRAGAFQGIRADKNGTLKNDEFHVVKQCWESVEKELCPLEEYVRGTILTKPSRILVELSSESEEHILRTTSHVFQQLSDIKVRNKRGSYSYVGKVAASKILFSVLPEIALPVDNAEWKYVFCTENFSEVLLGMLTEIKEWEKVTKKKLDELDTNNLTTLPAIYNVLAMAARPLQKAN